MKSREPSSKSDDLMLQSENVTTGESVISSSFEGNPSFLNEISSESTSESKESESLSIYSDIVILILLLNS